MPLCLDVSRNLSRKGQEGLLFVFLKCQIQHFYVSVGNKELLLTQRKSTAVPLISASLIIKLSHIDMSRMVKSFLPAPCIYNMYFVFFWILKVLQTKNPSIFWSKLFSKIVLFSRIWFWKLSSIPYLLYLLTVQSDSITPSSHWLLWTS